MYHFLINLNYIDFFIYYKSNMLRIFPFFLFLST